MPTRKKSINENTKLIYISSVWKNNGVQDFSLESLKKAESKIHNDGFSHQMIFDKSTNKEQCALTSKVIYDKFGGKSNYKFHYNSDWVRRLTILWKKLNRREKSFVGTNLSEWCPANIWAMSTKAASTRLEDAVSIYHLNEILGNLVNTKDLLPLHISDKPNSNPKIKEIAVKEASDKTLWDGYDVDVDGFFNSDEVLIKFKIGTNRGIVELKEWSGYDDQVRAKIRYLSENLFMKSSVEDMIIDQKILTGSSRFLRSGNALMKRVENRDPDLLKSFYELYSSYTREIKLDYRNFLEKIADLDNDYIFSKYRSLNTLDGIINNNIQKPFLYCVISYCMKRKDLICPHLKVK